MWSVATRRVRGRSVVKQAYYITDGVSATAVLRQGLKDLMQVCGHLSGSLDTALKSHDKK
jgi:hypothetical protein